MGALGLHDLDITAPSVYSPLVTGPKADDEEGVMCRPLFPSLPCSFPLLFILPLLVPSSASTYRTVKHPCTTGFSSTLLSISATTPTQYDLVSSSLVSPWMSQADPVFRVPASSSPPSSASPCHTELAHNHFSCSPSRRYCVGSPRPPFLSLTSYPPLLSC